VEEEEAEEEESNGTRAITSVSVLRFFDAAEGLLGAF